MTGPAAGNSGSSGNSVAAVDSAHLRALILAERASIKLDRQAFLRMIAGRATADQVIADLVAMFTRADQPPQAVR